MARRAGPVPEARAAAILFCCFATASGVSPKRVVPSSAGELRKKISTRGTTARAAPATSSDACRHPLMSTNPAIRGKNTSWPVALPALRIPTTSPRLATNHRSTTVATKTRAIEPDPTPIRMPQVSLSCQESVTKMLRAAPAEIKSRAPVVTLRNPKRSIRAAAKGATRPNSRMLMPTATLMVVRLQPNSDSRGRIITPGAARKPAAPRSAKKATPATIQAGCKRRHGADGSRDDIEIVYAPFFTGKPQ